MGTINLLQNIQNPLSDIDILKRLVEEYSKLDTINSSYYYYLSSLVEKKYLKGEHYAADSDELFSNLFNMWKNSIVKLSPERIAELKKSGEYNTDIDVLKEFLSGIEDVKTEKEAREIIKKEYDNEELNKAIKKYRWDSLAKGGEYTHICSKYLTAKRDKFPEIEHRLYITCESIAVYQIANDLVKKCVTYGVPYYFKFTQKCIRDDNLIIFSDSDNLTNYIKILEEIKNERENIAAYLKDAPMLTGKIKPWLGYGSEPQSFGNDKDSYLGIRASIIEESIKEVLYKYIKTHITSSTTYKGKTMQYRDYLAIVITEYFCEELKKRLKTHENNSKKGLEVESLGYKIEDVENGKFKSNICNVLRDSLINNLFLIFDNKIDKIKDIKMKVRDEKEVAYTSSDLQIAINKIAKHIFNNEPKLYDELKQTIINNAAKFGISSENFAVGNYIASRLEKLTEKELEEQVITDDETAAMIECDKIIGEINPDILMQSIKMPNGDTITVLNYLKEVVFPLVPTNGIFILKDGTEVKAVEFIEKYILGECQTLFAGNLPQYLNEKTKMNQGKLQMNYQGQNVEIEAMDIVDFIDPIKLTEKITFANGKTITAEEYIEVHFADYIPANGKFILRDNSEISAIDYIEQVLLGENQEKYKGNICQILYMTTKQNRGIIKIKEELDEIS